MPAQYLSEVARLSPSRRASAYRGYLKRFGRQDTLQNRIDARVGLEEEDVRELTSLLTQRCQERTKNAVKWGLMNAPHIKNYGIYGRLIKDQHGWSYCAGQSYTDEIRVVRNLLK